jgi:hypothetical protein
MALHAAKHVARNRSGGHGFFTAEGAEMGMFSGFLASSARFSLWNLCVLGGKMDTHLNSYIGRTCRSLA